MKYAVILANLGGPDRLEAVRPFLFNLFNDRAIFNLPQPARALLAQLVSRRRARVARGIYAQMGGRSPILPETQAQADALDILLRAQSEPGREFRVFVAMRYWHPLVEETVRAVRDWGPDKVLLLPLYPQFSTTTTASFFAAWDKAAKDQGLTVPDTRLCCHPSAPRFIAAHAKLIRAALAKAGELSRVRLLFSAHGLPKSVVAKGDPYQWQVEQTAAAIAAALALPALDWRICYQSRVGPLAWLEPSTAAEIRRAGAEGKGLVIVPVAFVSEHSETLVELDHDYGKLAAESSANPYLRVPALGIEPDYIAQLRALTLELATRTGIVAAPGAGLCPAACSACPHPGQEGHPL